MIEKLLVGALRGALIGAIGSWDNSSGKNIIYHREMNLFVEKHADTCSILENAKTYEEILNEARRLSDGAVTDFFKNIREKDYLETRGLRYRYLYLDYLVEQYKERVIDNKNHSRQDVADVYNSYINYCVNKIEEHYATAFNSRIRLDLEMKNSSFSEMIKGLTKWDRKCGKFTRGNDVENAHGVVVDLFIAALNNLNK